MFVVTAYYTDGRSEAGFKTASEAFIAFSRMCQLSRHVDSYSRITRISIQDNSVCREICIYDFGGEF